ncbi:zinc finger B-box domain-containing protein 1 [Eublepharis macularius]|uniref:Zinc finger B-box domain-containing protein 1 n=1 Tax=Eublepharis macularius TaxID=481883 RepID=A0AA97JLN6_EUBMA|nr:zinc finger B-box domain-containing protein 1 [Eublepharis macularius]
MNVNDFVILPGSKTGISVKLKAKSVRELQLEKVQLEHDNKEMERRLQQLQSNMSREKLEREKANGYHWKSGQAGLGLQPQLSQNKENVAKISSGKVKLRVLREQAQVPESAKQLGAHKVTSAASTEKPKAKGKACGQCETKTALLVCLDCGEDYCPSCFARIHQKGAMKLHRTTCLQAKVHVPPGKLEAAQQFLKQIYSNESNGKINYEQKKEVKEDPSDIFSSLPKMPTHDIEEASTVPRGVLSKCPNGGSLLHGTFNEEESARFFQEALNQWRSRNSPRKLTEERCCQSWAESVETCEVQTSPPVIKKTMEIQFKEDSLKYMEKLWLKKYRRTPFDTLPDILSDEFNPAKSPINEAYDTLVGEEEKEEEEVVNAHLAAEEMKKYWTDVRKEEPEALPVNLESSLKIEVLEDACEEEPEETASFVIMEAGSDDCDYSGTMSENHRTEADVFLAQAVDISTRSPLSSAVDKENDFTLLRNKHKETPRASALSAQSERMETLGDLSSMEEVSSIPYERATTKEEHTVATKNRSCVSPGQSSSPLALASREPSPMTELLKDCKRAQELRKASPITTSSSVLLQEVALKEKPVRTPYRGLEGFFAVRTNSEEVMLDLLPSPHTGTQSPSSDVSFLGSEQWIRHFSFSECADETVAQDVFTMELSRPSSRLGRQSPRTRASFSISPSERAVLRPFSANQPCYRTSEHTPRPSSAVQRGYKSSATAPLSRAASEISEIENIDVTECDDPSLEDSTDQQALADLESELQSSADLQEELSGITSEDLSASNRYSEMAIQNCTSFHKNHEIKDYSKSYTIRVYDSHTDDEEDTWQDKQQVKELC